jgi:ATP-dependent DNA helicase DinG
VTRGVPDMQELMGQDAADRITPEAADAIRCAIREAGGREVFFAGQLDGHGMIGTARVCARGHHEAVPARFNGLGTRDVVVHNHPSGDLEPSEADLALAVAYERHGHGVYIVDNDVSRVYVVIEPFVQDQRRALDVEALEDALRPNGRLARILPHYEIRPQQQRMLELAAGAFNDDGIAVIEAPTGVGKTMAYLLPAVHWALANRERVVVSTRTINLQEQIMFKDVPIIQKGLGQDFKAVLVKGRSNYVCRRRLERAMSEATLYDDEGESGALRALWEWVEHTKDGSLSDLAFVPPRDLWSRVCSDADACGAAQCHGASDCFITRARREMAKADVLVVNHHMLFSDLAIKQEMGNFSALAVLPSYQRVILDEAHSVEDSATEYFGLEVTRLGTLALLGRFVRTERQQERGLLPFIKLKLVQKAISLPMTEVDKILDLIDNSLLPALAAAREACQVVFAAVRSVASEKCAQIGRDIKWRLTEEALRDGDLRELYRVYVQPAAEELRTCAQHAGALHQWLRKVQPGPGEEESPLQMETVQVGSYRDRLLRTANNLSEMLGEELTPNSVRWIELDSKNEGIVRLAQCPLEVSKPMAEWVYPNLKTLVMTSATLSVEQRFDFFFSRVGLGAVHDREIESAVLDTPFNYSDQALLCIPRDLAAPDEAAFGAESVECIREILKITGGHAFVLYTSFHALDYAYRQLQGELRRAGITPLKQGAASRSQLLEQFRADTASVLFATDSFWEGVDVAGDALQCVIVSKLPFRVPTEPVQQARAEAIDDAGENSFMRYTVPQAVIKFRQGFGRLIRRKSDWGAIVVLDKRVLTRHYGKIFLNSLPEVRKVIGPGADVLRALDQFFQTKRGR